MKQVKYKGQVFNVPEWARFIAADANGAVWVYECLPDSTYAEDKYMRSAGKGEEVGQLTNKRHKVKEIK